MKNESVTSKQSSLRVLYYRYKDSVYYQLFIIVSVFMICIILFSQLVIPQIQDWFSIRNEVLATRERIDIINQNINFMNNLDKQQVKNQVDIATKALPFEKDFGVILTALNNASLESGVSLEDFTFQVGNIASVSAQENTIQKDLSFVDLTISVANNVDGVNRFLDAINKKLPLVEVTDVDGDALSTAITLRFFQKKFPNIIFKDDQPVVPLSDKQTATLREFGTWIVPEEETTVSTDSGTTIPLF